MTPARIIFSTGSLHLMDIAQCFELAAEAGCDGVEILCDHRWSTRDPQNLATLSARHHLPVLALHTPYTPRVDGWRNPGDFVERISQTLQLAETLSAEVIVVHSPVRASFIKVQFPKRHFFLPWRTPFRPIKRWIEHDLTTIQAGTAVKIAIENNPVSKWGPIKADPSWWPRLDQWSQIHQYLTMDTTHWATHGVKPLEAYRAANGRVAHVHLSNYQDGRQHRLPHHGELDLGALLRTMATDGYNGLICLELYPDSLGFDDSAAVRRNLKDSVAFCRKHLEQGC